MKFLDINFTKDSSVLLRTIHSPFYWRILQKVILFSGFKNPYQKIHETRKLNAVQEFHIWPESPEFLLPCSHGHSFLHGPTRSYIHTCTVL
jgi:hypothetical protein